MVSPFDMTEADAQAPEAEQGSPVGPGKAKGRASRYQLQMARSNLLLAALFLSGAAAVYGLSLRKVPSQATVAPTQIENQVDSAILRFSQDPKVQASAPAAGRLTHDLLQTFYDQVGQRQVPLGRLRKNPFVFVPPAPPVSVTPATVPGEAPPVKLAGAADKDLQEQLKKLKGLHLQSVMMGRDNAATAMISNNLLTVGQTIEGFTVMSIAANSVILQWQNKEFELPMP